MNKPIHFITDTFANHPIAASLFACFLVTYSAAATSITLTVLGVL